MGYLHPLHVIKLLLWILQIVHCWRGLMPLSQVGLYVWSAGAAVGRVSSLFSTATLPCTSGTSTWTRPRHSSVNASTNSPGRYNNNNNIMLQWFNSVLLHDTASWPARPMTIRHFDFSIFWFLTPGIFTTWGIIYNILQHNSATAFFIGFWT